MAAGTGGSPSGTRVLLGGATPDRGGAGGGAGAAMGRSRHDSRGIRAPHSRCGSRKLRRYRYGCEMWGAQHAAPLPIPTGRARRLAPSAVAFGGFTSIGGEVTAYTYPVTSPPMLVNPPK